jgi:predicted amidohydrolase
LTICYDVRFPNLYRELAKQGADFISIPAAFTYTTGLAHWHSLIRARAIENGCFVFAPAQVGNHENGRKTYGHSMIVDPWGKVISSATGRKGIIYAKVDPTLVRKSREKIPSMISFL